MKMDPIQFRKKFEEGQLFQAYRDENGNYVFQRDVVCQPMMWNHGSAVRFTIVERLCPENGGNRERVIADQTFYDKDYPQFLEDLQIAVHGDLRGWVAEMWANRLFVKIFIPSDIMKKHLPNVVKWYQNKEVKKE